MNNYKIEAYTDGSCQLQNVKRPGAASAIILINGIISFEKSLSFINTTNNQMELISALMVLKELERLHFLDENITIFSDSQYLVKGMNDYIDNWVVKKFKDVKNSNIWKKLLPFKKNNIKFIWIKGHDKNEYNIMVDKLAQNAMKEIAEKYNTNF